MATSTSTPTFIANPQRRTGHNNQSLVALVPLGTLLKAHDQANLLFVMLWFNFCPERLVNALAKGHPADGSLRSDCWELIYLSLGERFWFCCKFNIWPFAFPYGGTPTDVYSEEKYSPPSINDRYSSKLSKFYLNPHHVVGFELDSRSSSAKRSGDSSSTKTLEESDSMAAL